MFMLEKLNNYQISIYYFHWSYFNVRFEVNYCRRNTEAAWSQNIGSPDMITSVAQESTIIHPVFICVILYEKTLEID